MTKTVSYRQDAPPVPRGAPARRHAQFGGDSRWPVVLAAGLVLLVVAGPAAAQEPLVSGDQFLAGSSVVDVVGLSDDLLANPGFFLDARWSQARFQVRPTDAFGIPLIGPAATGAIRGSLMHYKGGWADAVFAGDGPELAVFIGLDYYVATHIGDFFTLFNPFAGFGAPFTGAKETGFAAVAGQIMPGLRLRLADVGLALRGGYLFNFRDAIDESGRFISTYTGADMTGRYADGDYADTGEDPAIPPGVGGISGGEPYVGASWFGVDLIGVFTSDNRLALLQLASPLARTLRGTPAGNVLRYITPAFTYLERQYQPYVPDDLYQLSLATGIQLEDVFADIVFDAGIPGEALAALELERVQINQAQLTFYLSGFLLGGSVIRRVPEEQQAETTWGVRAGLGNPPGSSLGEFMNGSIEATASYNFADDLVGGLNVRDNLIFPLHVAEPGRRCTVNRQNMDHLMGTNVRTSWRAALTVLLAAVLLAGCAVNPLTSKGPIDEPHPGGSGGQMIIWVAPDGDDANPGTREDPVQSIQLAINRMGLEFRETDDIPRMRYEVRVAAGTYTPGAGLVEQNIGVALTPWHTVDGFFDTQVVLSGGWDIATGERNDVSDPGALSILDGAGVLQHVMLLNRDDLTVSGFVVRGGNASNAPAGTSDDFSVDDERLAGLWTTGGGLYVTPGLDGITVNALYLTGNQSDAGGATALYVAPRSATGQSIPQLEVYLDADSDPAQTTAGELSGTVIGAW